SEDTQVFEGEEANLYRHFERCNKNPSHSKFIDVSSFDICHLPEPYRDPDLYQLIKDLAGLTVRVCVTETSSKRPKFWPNKEEAYPFSEPSESKKQRTGTGRVMNLVKYTSGYSNLKTKHYKGYTSCQCQTCKDSHFPEKDWWEIQVLTATHVVFDNDEAKSTHFRFLFDSDDSPLVTLTGATVIDADIETDNCKLNLSVCNMSLGYRLFEIMKNYNQNLEKVFTICTGQFNPFGLTIIISHPHGCSKKVSIGECVTVEQVGQHCFNNRLIYTTSTCKGSSGAPVLCLDYIGWDPHVHSGTREESKYNYSGPGPIGRVKPSKKYPPGIRNLYNK
ncbi:hypothetical protein BgiMline_020383, partial [Biomphalaria glabrata]